MMKIFIKNPQEFIDYDSDLLFRIFNKTPLETKNSNDKVLFVDENWKINSKIKNNSIASDNSYLKKILSEIFLNKKISI